MIYSQECRHPLDNLPGSASLNPTRDATWVRVPRSEYEGLTRELDQTRQELRETKAKMELLSSRLFVTAARRGDVARVAQWVAQGDAMINQRVGRKGRNALIEACYHNHVAVVAVLLECNDLDVNAECKDQQTALQIACKYGRINIAVLLLDRLGINVNRECRYGYTALHYAAEESRVETARLLLNDPRILINVQNMYGDTPLHYAIRNSGGVSLLLLDRPDIQVNIPDEEDRMPLWCASQLGQLEAVSLLLQRKDIDLDACDKEEGKSAFLIACHSGQTDVMRLFLRREVNINHVDLTGSGALHCMNHAPPLYYKTKTGYPLCAFVLLRLPRTTLEKTNKVREDAKRREGGKRVGRGGERGTWKWRSVKRRAKGTAMAYH